MPPLHTCSLMLIHIHAIHACHMPMVWWDPPPPLSPLERGEGPMVRVRSRPGRVRSVSRIILRVGATVVQTVLTCYGSDIMCSPQAGDGVSPAWSAASRRTELEKRWPTLRTLTLDEAS